MTDGLIRFHLRSIGTQWAKPMISAETIIELERQRFIERSLDGTAIRLTGSGARQKQASQQAAVPSMNHSRTPDPGKMRRRKQRMHLPMRGLA